jgi:hypothetical protein
VLLRPISPAFFAARTKEALDASARRRKCRHIDYAGSPASGLNSDGEMQTE